MTPLDPLPVAPFSGAKEVWRNPRAFIGAIILRIELVVALDVFIRDIHSPSDLAVDDLAFFHFRP